MVFVCEKVFQLRLPNVYIEIVYEKEENRTIKRRWNINNIKISIVWRIGGRRWVVFFPTFCVFFRGYEYFCGKHHFRLLDGERVQK